MIKFKFFEAFEVQKAKSFLSPTDLPLDQNSNPVPDDLESSNMVYR